LVDVILPFIEVILPFIEVILPFIEVILPFIEVILPFIEAPVIFMAKDVVATYTLITKAAITIAELMSTYLHLYIKAIQPAVCIKYFLPTEASEPLSAVVRFELRGRWEASKGYVVFSGCGVLLVFLFAFYMNML
jgi:hypothetical protein